METGVSQDGDTQFSWARQGRPPRIAIIGAGMSGIGAVIKLRKAGYTDLTVYEKADEVGGTWRDNHYPGLSCDVPSYWYSYSFEPNPDWSYPLIFLKLGGYEKTRELLRDRFGDTVRPRNWLDRGAVTADGIIQLMLLADEADMDYTSGDFIIPRGKN